MNEEGKLIKPITIVRAEFVQKITDLINDSMLPPFIIEPILKDMYLQSKTMAQKQYEIDKKNYENELLNLQSKNNEKGGK